MNNFINNLDRPGGHMLVCIFVMVFGSLLAWLGLMDNLGRDLVIGAASVIFMAMKGEGKTHTPGSTELNVSKTVTPPVVPPAPEVPKD